MEQEAKPSTIREDSRHGYFMKQAVAMGEKALATGETPVGCVLVYNDKIVGSGMNDTNRSMNGTRHAEFLAIAEMLQTYPKSAIRETDLYVTVEPCIMCSAALRQYGIRSVFVGTHNVRFGGVGGVLTIHSEKEAITLLRQFYIQENEKAPNPRPKKNRALNTTFDFENEDEADDFMPII
ncbi:hypothetical protein N7533_001877 [Penicillium manginii]|uniref:uncharacterized protein n=1 Tax=Penicillium manginii TaxID=203109 RepID=UPI002548C885|nr:uncharacterized protein N7533_001877 [Penicillium manginii]KAJ5763196.1 hypothetical protein N7533_001877 [Penicillium manginii]